MMIVPIFIGIIICLSIPVGITCAIIAIVNSSQKKAEQQKSGEIPPKPPREKLSASAVMLLIGTAFILLSAITFVAANWVKMDAGGRVVALLAESGLAFGISALMKKIINLNGTSISFYMIGTIIAVISFITAGYYDLMGDWFSVDGDGFAILYAVSALAIASSSFAAKALYKSRAFDYIGSSFVSLALFFVCMQPSGNLREFVPIIGTAQLILTAVIHIIKPQKNTEMEHPVRIVGDISAVVYQLIPAIYVLYSTSEPDAFTFIALVIVLAQLALYGILKGKKWLFIPFNVIGIYTGLVVSGIVEESAGEHLAMIVFAFITTAFYIANRFIPNNLLSCKIITFIAQLLATVVSFAAIDDDNLILCFIVPVITAAAIFSYTLNNDKSLQSASGLFSPVIPFIMANISANRLTHLTSMERPEVNVIVYGVLLLVYFAAASFFIFLPKINFNIYAHHPLKSEVVIYSNIVFATAVLLNISKYSQLFMIPVALAVVHFVISYNMSCNITATGSVISVIMLINSIFANVTDDDNARMYTMLALFVVLVIVSRIIFPDGFITKTEDKVKIDVILLSSWTAIVPFELFDRDTFFFRAIAVAVFVAGFIKKNTDKDNAAVMISISSTIACFAFMTRPFLTPDSSMIASKVNIAIFAILGIAYRIIWKNHAQVSKASSTIIFIISFISLIVDGIIFNSVGNKIFVLIVTSGILIFSFFVKSKTWFTASSIALVIMTVVSTYRYFNSAGWWIYLLAVGAILITVASVNEVYRKKGESVKSTVAKKFSDWTW